ncbi:MAG: 2-hydroxyacyl-CoA dehydratase [Syntrophaceae bacterium]|nr:2-hydroxyacyl-CoA dehydratase [Syntrophaceae bacterium]
MIDLLKLCGFEANEIESELPRIKQTFDKLGIDPEDIKCARERLNKYYAMELMGIRKAFRLYIKAVADMVLAREDGKTKIIYGYMAPAVPAIASALMSKSKDIYIGRPFQIIRTVLGYMFDKMSPVFEAAEQRWLKSGKVAHCGNLKSVVGIITSDLVPKPDILLTTGHLCDIAPKIGEMLGEFYDIPVYYYDTCQDRSFRDYPKAGNVVNLSANNMRRFSQKLQETMNVEITDDMLLESLQALDELGVYVRRIYTLLEASDPLPISPANEMIWRSLSLLPLSIGNIQAPLDALHTLYEELKERVNQGVGVVKKGAPRIMTLLPPHTTDPRLEHLLCDVGLSLACTEGSFYPPNGRRTADAEKTRDPYKIMSMCLLSSMYDSTGGRISTLIETCKRLKIDGVLARYHVGCRTITGDPIIIKNAMVKELGIPVQLFEWESFDSRVYDHETYRENLELFKTILDAGLKS